MTWICVYSLPSSHLFLHSGIYSPVFLTSQSFRFQLKSYVCKKLLNQFFPQPGLRMLMEAWAFPCSVGAESDCFTHPSLLSTYVRSDTHWYSEKVNGRHARDSMSSLSVLWGWEVGHLGREGSQKVTVTDRDRTCEHLDYKHTERFVFKSTVKMEGDLGSSF